MGSGRLYFFFSLTIRIERGEVKKEKEGEGEKEEKKKLITEKHKQGRVSPRLALSFKSFLGVSFLIFFNRIIHSWWGGASLLLSILVRFFVFIYFPFFCCCSFILTCILLSVSPSLDRQTPGLHGHVWCTQTHTHTLKSKDTLVRGARKSEGISRWRGISRLCVPFEYRSSSCRLVVAVQVCCCCCCASSASPASEQRSTD